MAVASVVITLYFRLDISPNGLERSLGARWFKFPGESDEIRREEGGHYPIRLHSIEVQFHWNRDNDTGTVRRSDRRRGFLRRVVRDTRSQK
jgi:hypothetical protein